MIRHRRLRPMNPEVAGVPGIKVDWHGYTAARRQYEDYLAQQDEAIPAVQAEGNRARQRAADVEQSDREYIVARQARERALTPKEARNLANNGPDFQ